MLDDRERGLLEEMERELLADPGLQRRLNSRGPRLRRALAVPALATLVVFLAVAVVALLVLALPLQSLVVAVIAVWPCRALRRRLRARRRPTP